MPIRTITPRTGNPDFLQIIHTDSGGHSSTIARSDLEPFKGAWIEAREQLRYATSGSYSLTLTRLTDGQQLLSVDSPNIDLWRDGTTFVRPKWGIYRSLISAQYLRDEVVLFADVCLAKGSDTCDASNSSRVGRLRQLGPSRAPLRAPTPTPHKH